MGGGAVGAGWIGSSGAGTGAGATGTSFATATVSTCAPIDAIDMDAGAASACGSGSAMGVGTAVTGSELMSTAGASASIASTPGESFMGSQGSACGRRDAVVR